MKNRGNMQISDEGTVMLMVIEEDVSDDTIQCIDSLAMEFPEYRFENRVLHFGGSPPDYKDICYVRVESSKPGMIEMILDMDEDPSILCILDLTGGNTFDDLASLLEKSLEEGDRFACAYVRPKSKGLGCWAIERGIFSSMKTGEFPDIEMRMLELAFEEDLELWKVLED